MAYVVGTDIHSLSRPKDWTALHNAGCRFIFIKASDNNWADRSFSDNWKESKDAGLLRGAYHFFHWETNTSRATSSQQAEIFIKTIGTDKGELPPVCDLETVFDFTRKPPLAFRLPPVKTLVERLKGWLDSVEKDFGRKPIIYTSASFVNSTGINNNNAPWIVEYPLWLAQYPYAPGTKGNYRDPNADLTASKGMPAQPTKFPSWSWSFWQWSAHGRMGGFPDNQDVDFDYFNGSYEDLLKWANAKEPTPIHPKPDPDPDDPKPDPDPDPDDSYYLYTVQPKDTLGDIAKFCINKYGIKKNMWTLVDEIVKANPDKIKTKSNIQEGWELKIPKS